VGNYTWEEAYARANQYAQFFLSQGVLPGDFVGFFMRNTPDFPLAWFGLTAIGAAPALLNCSLKGESLVHCIDIAAPKVIMVDGESELLDKVNEAKDHLALKDLIVVDLGQLRSHIYSLPATRPPDELRSGVTPASPMMLFYTRWDHEIELTFFCSLSPTLELT
jgi:acyl-CoA synthetase (AMP-forming)/AMP-acid ligase II